MNAFLMRQRLLVNLTCAADALNRCADGITADGLTTGQVDYPLRQIQFAIGKAMEVKALLDQVRDRMTDAQIEGMKGGRHE